MGSLFNGAPELDVVDVALISVDGIKGKLDRFKSYLGLQRSREQRSPVLRSGLGQCRVEILLRSYFENPDSFLVLLILTSALLLIDATASLESLLSL